LVDVQLAAQSIERYVNISSKVSAEQEISIIPQASGTVKNLYVSLGDAVQTGQILFEIDDTDAQIKVQQAQGSYNTSQTSVDSYKINYDDLLKALDKTQKLYDIGAASQNELDDAQSSVNQTKLQLDAAQKDLEYSASASLSSAQKELSDTKVKAEINGIVSSLDIAQGGTASTQSPALTLVNMDNLKVSFQVSEDVINLIGQGSTVYVTVSAVSKEPITASVTGVSTAADSSTGLYLVEAALPNPDGALKPGMFANVELVVEKNTDVISVPLNTVLEKNGEQYVFTIDASNIAHKILVETGLKNDDYIEITNGLSIGDTVVTKGQDFLSEGSQVNITGDETETVTAEQKNQPESEVRQ
jgi:RND family efflux transporter MFP subunit